MEFFLTVLGFCLLIIVYWIFVWVFRIGSAGREAMKMVDTAEKIREELIRGKKDDEIR